MDPVTIGLTVAGSIFGNSKAKKAARAQQEMAKRQAEATWLNQQRQLNANYGMGIENLWFSTQQQLLQEKLNNKAAQENWLYAQKMEDLKLKEINRGIAASNKKRAALGQLKREGMIISHAGQLAQQTLAKSSAEKKLRKNSSAAAAKIGSRAAARGLLPGSPMNNPMLLMNVDEVAQAQAEMSAKDDMSRRVATSLLHRQLAASHINAQGQAMKRKVEGRPPQLFDSTRMMMHLAKRNASNMLSQYQLGLTNARAGRAAMLANANTAYQNQRSAANAQMWTGIGTTIAGGIAADLKFGPSVPGNSGINDAAALEFEVFETYGGEL